jgi:biofilm PGA synthesis N-glycosyltransferase PgaC
MEILTGVYFFYMFFAIYFLIFFILLYTKNSHRMYECPKPSKQYSVSVIIPCYNEQDTIEGTLTAVNSLTYPGLKSIIAVNDGSKDNTLKILNELKKKFSKLVVYDKPNGGKSDAVNYGIKKAKTELVVVVDSDSFPAPDALENSVGFFNDPKVGVVTIPILVRNKKTLLGRMQALEYATIALTRKLLEPINAIYVTPGPFAVYRRKVLLEVGLFDTKNITEDVEITWRLAAHGWKRAMSMCTKVTTIAPEKLRLWWRQRNRWDMGGMQCIAKYWRLMFKDPKNVVGYFVVPFFALSMFLGFLGLSIFAFLIGSRLINQYLLAKFALIADTYIFSLDSFILTPSMLTYFGIILFILGAFFSAAVLYLMGETIFKKRNFFEFFFYLIVYLFLYPLVLVTATFKMIRRDMSW